MAGNRPARERFEFSLDARQVAAVILGSLSALAVAFFLGHALGQRIAERPAAPVAARTPAAAPAPADALAELDKAPRSEGGDPKTPLTYHDALTAPRPPADKLPAVPKAATPVLSAEAPRGTALPATTQAAASGPTGSSGTSGTTGTTGPAQAATAPAPGPSGAPPAPTPAVVAPAPAPQAAQKAAPPPKATAAAAAPKAATAAPRAPSGKGAFSVQVGSTQDRFEAERIAARFASRGPKVSVAEVPGKGRWYRVRLGSFETREAADRYLKDLERTTGSKGFVAAN